MLRAIPDDELGALERPLYLCAVMTGLRQGELLALKWQDVDWTARRVRVADNYPRGRYDRVESPKSHLLRSVPMADRLAGELDRHFQGSAWQTDDDLVFCHPHTGRPYDASKLRKRFDDAVARAEVRRITFHELRHTFGTQMAAAGAPLRAIQDWLGHADAATTQIYAHYAPDATNGAAFVERAFGTGRAARGCRGRGAPMTPLTKPTGAARHTQPNAEARTALSPVGRGAAASPSEASGLTATAGGGTHE